MDSTKIAELSKIIFNTFNSNDNSGRFIILLAGIPGSGKTTLANKLVKLLNEMAHTSLAISLSMDGFHLTKEQLSNFEDPKSAFLRRGAPWTFTPEELLNKLTMIKTSINEIVLYPSFDHSIGDPIVDDLSILPSHKIVILEGNYLLYNVSPWNKLHKLSSYTLFLNCPLELSKERLIKRHIEAGIEPNYEKAKERVNSNDFKNAKLILDNIIQPDEYVD